MNKDKPVKPPGWAQWLLSFYCRPELLEDLQGDLNEYFQRNVKAKGIKKARLIYIIDVIKFFRYYTVRKPEFVNLLIHRTMMGSYIKTSGRSIVRQKLFSVINIVGLAISMSVGLLMISILSDLFSYDNFHKKKDRIYRIITTDQNLDNPVISLASTSVKAAKKIREVIPGVEELTVLRREFQGDASVGDKILPLSALWASQSFFNVFSFPLLQGDPATALKEPYSLVLTETTAKKLFGNTNILGKFVKFDTVNYLVTGVAKDIPKLSHLKYEALISFSTLDLQKADPDGDLLSWESIYSNYIYLVIAKNGNSKAMQAALNRLCEQENVANKNRKITLSLQPLKAISVGKPLANEIGPVMNSVVLWVLGGLALIVILSAGFNYTNLSIARSLRRSREVGIRKVVGALKSHVLGQFITESVIISLVALVFSFLIFLFLRGQFLSFHSFLESLFALNLSVKIILYFIVLAVLVGFISGLLPAVFYSRINAIRVLKDVSTLKLFRHINLRKGLIVIQYTFSIMFITATIIGYNQYKGFLSLDLGFTTENILNIRMQGNHNDLFIKELSALPAVKDISKSRIVTSIGSIYGTQMKYNNPQDSAGVWINFIDEHYLPLHKHKFASGRNLSAKSKNTEETEVIVNEQVLRRFNIAHQDPRKALDEVINVDGKKLTIVGVLKDFHYGTAENKIEPMVFRYSADEPSGYVNAKIGTKDWLATLASIEMAWQKIDKVHPMDAKFYDEQIEQNYSQFAVMIKVIGFFSFLAICIASMGLFGMVVYTTERRMKEISIRKVLGASEGKLIYLLSKGFLFLLIISSMIALPVTWIFFDKVVLINFAYHKSLNWNELFLSVFILVIIAFITIGSQTLRVARSNPAKVLKRE